MIQDIFCFVHYCNTFGHSTIYVFYPWFPTKLFISDRNLTLYSFYVDPICLNIYLCSILFYSHLRRIYEYLAIFFNEHSLVWTPSNNWLKSSAVHSTFVSSANNIKCSSLDTLLISLLYNKKNFGPRTDPWGTPQVTSKHEKNAPPTSGTFSFYLNNF